jgi:hypothetical protein
MSILDKLRTKSVQPQQEEVVVETKQQTSNENDLGLEEITFLLSAIKDSTFKVSDVELVYNTIIKLQSQFIVLSGKKTKKDK